MNVAKRMCSVHNRNARLLCRQISSFSLQHKSTEIRQKPCMENIVKRSNSASLIQSNGLSRINFSHFNFPLQNKTNVHCSTARYFSSGNDNGDSPEDASSGMMKILCCLLINTNNIRFLFFNRASIIFRIFQEWQIWLMKLILKICLY